MNTGNRPHSRKKTVGTGTANVAKGEKVDTGSRPIGFSRPAAGKPSGSSSAGQGGVRPSSGFGKTGRTPSAGSGFGTRPSGTINRPSGQSPRPVQQSRPFGFGQPTQNANPRTSAARPDPNSVNTSRPVDFNFTPSQTSGNTGSRKTNGGKFNIKTVLIIAIVIILILSAKNFLGGSDEPAADIGGYNNSYTYNDDPYSYENSSYGSSYDSAYGSSSSYGFETSYDTVSNTAETLPVSTDGMRAKFYTPAKGDKVTVMIYMCGTDLESKSGMATKDINEMLKAELGDNVNIVIETGGCKKWNNTTFSSSCNQIYRIGSKGLAKVEDNFGTTPMTDPDNLAKFIQYCKKNYAADRSILILWDHGGGTVSGYGYDEKYADSGSMTLNKIGSALKKGGVKFDFIGFDACLMATLETGLVCSDYADYLVASEETEPGTGWYYTTWLNKLAQDTSVPTVELAKSIIDTFVSSCRSQSYNSQVTLSAVDLAELAAVVPQTLKDFSESVSSSVSENNYKNISNARANARQFAASSKLNQIDLIDFAQRVGTVEANTLASALKNCVKANGTTISRSNGISVYFPYETKKNVSSALSTFDSIGTDEKYAECMSEYADCVRLFSNIQYAGQTAGYASQTWDTGSASYGSFDFGSLFNMFSGFGNSSYSYESSSPIEALTGAYSGVSSTGYSSAGYGMSSSSILDLLGGFGSLGSSYTSDGFGYDWLDTSFIGRQAETVAENFLDPSRLTATVKNGNKVLDLTEEEWSLIQTVELNVFANDGEGFLDLGYDNVFEFLDDGSMLLDYDGTWLTLNGNVCSYYLESDTEQDDGSYVTVGRIPALLNGELVDLQAVFNDDNPDGVITGAFPKYENDSIGVLAKGDIEILPGDTIRLLCDYYDLDSGYDSAYTLSDAFTVPSSGLKLENLELNAEELSPSYRFTDIYGNFFWLSIE